MATLKNKIILITGASSGIGKSCAEQFAAAGARLVLTARRIEKIQTLALTLKKNHGVECLALKLDVQDKKQVQRVIKNLPKDWKDIDIVINNAGLALGLEKFQDGDPDQWDIMIATNIQGLLYITRALLPNMITRKQGHIINISSVAGYEHYPHGNVYGATKFAVRSLTKSLRLDLMGTGIRVTEIAPGMVETEFSEVRFNKNKARAKAIYAGMTPLTPNDIADSVIFAATRPPHVNVELITVYPTDQASVTQVCRRK